MSTVTITQSKANIIKKKKTDSTRGIILFRALFLPIAFLIVWELVTRIGILPSFLFSSPSLIIIRAIDLISTGKLWSHMEISLFRALLGFLLGGGLGLVFGIVVGMNRKSEHYLNPSFQMIRTVPLLPSRHSLFYGSASRTFESAINIPWIFLSVVHASLLRNKKYRQ